MAKILLILGLVALGIYYYTAQRPIIPTTTVPSPSQLVSPENSGVEVLAKNLDIPWEIAFLPDPPSGEASKTFFVTERKGIVWQLGIEKKQILKLADVAAVGEGGLLGIAHHPKHEQNGYTYLYYTYKRQGVKNKVVRFVHVGDTLRQEKIIIENIPGNANHNGGRIKFGPDGKLYVTTGDSQNPSTAQDKNSLAGKILRLNDDGLIPSDNPFPNSPVYSYGHRNPQGLAWDSSGKLWATEHGQKAQDEVNLIEPGKNYGWPTIRGEERSDKMEAPYIQSGTQTWAPSGMTIKGGNLYFAGLRGEAIYKLVIKNIATKEYFKNQFGRIRTIVEGPDGNFYLLTSNRDGRGKPTAEDDRIIKISPRLLGL